MAPSYLHTAEGMYFSRTRLASFTAAFVATAAASFYFLLQELQIGHHAVADQVPLNDRVEGVHHVISTCQSTNTTFSCKSEVSNCEFITHKLPDGALLQFTLEPVHWLQCIYDGPVKITGHGGLTLMKVQTELVGSSAHREMRSTLTVHLREHKMCDMVVLQRFPPGVFVDLFQLEGLTARKAFEILTLMDELKTCKPKPALEDDASRLFSDDEVKSFYLNYKDHGAKELQFMV